MSLYRGFLEQFYGDRKCSRTNRVRSAFLHLEITLSAPLSELAGDCANKGAKIQFLNFQLPLLFSRGSNPVSQTTKKHHHKGDAFLLAARSVQSSNS